MSLFNFFSCCFSKTTVVEEKPKTYNEIIFDKESTYFKEFSRVDNKNENISPLYYDVEKYNNTMKDVNNDEEPLWKTRILCYTIRNNPVFMCYDPYKLGFTYYSSEAYPYDILNVIAMKYVRIFYCYEFFMDNKCVYYPEIKDNVSKNDTNNENNIIVNNTNENNTSENNDEQPENGNPNTLYTIHYIDVDKKNKPITDGPFAKLKKNNPKSKEKNNSNNNTMGTSKKENGKNIENNEKHKRPNIPRIKNKFIHGGNLYNFEFLKKVKTKQGFKSPVIDSMKGFSYKDFKSMNTL